MVSGTFGSALSSRTERNCSKDRCSFVMTRRLRRLEPRVSRGKSAFSYVQSRSRLRHRASRRVTDGDHNRLRNSKRKGTANGEGKLRNAHLLAFVERDLYQVTCTPSRDFMTVPVERWNCVRDHPSSRLSVRQERRSRQITPSPPSRSCSLQTNIPRNQRFLMWERMAARFVHSCGNCAPFADCRRKSTVRKKPCRGISKPHLHGCVGTSRVGKFTTTVALRNVFRVPNVTLPPARAR